MDQNIRLSNGRLMSQLEIGTAFVDDPKVVEQSTTTAFKVGYRHIDVDQAFAGIDGIHSAISAAGLDRDQVFVTGKLSIEAIDHYEIGKAVDRLLNSLGTSYVDALLMRSLGSSIKNSKV